MRLGQSIRENWGKIIVWGGVTVTLAVVPLVTPLITDPIVEQRLLYNQMVIVADTDRNDATTDDEWAKVYREFGLPYNVHGSNPLEDLTSEQMKQYLANH